MKAIKINGKEYKIEYSIEASLYSKCMENIMDSLIGVGVFQGKAQLKDVEGMINELKKTVSNVPAKVLVLFHAGLLENHDLSEKESKELLKAYLKESKKSYSEVLGELMTIVNEDNFFELIGVDKMFAPNEQKEESGEVGESSSKKK